MTLFVIIRRAPLTRKAPHQMFIKKAFRKQIYSYSNILLPCNSVLISTYVSGHQVLSELREVDVLDYPPVQGFVCRVLLDTKLQIMTSQVKTTIL